MSPTRDLVCGLADRFVDWQTPYGRPDPDGCPFVTPGQLISTQFHSSTYLAIALYRAFEETGDRAYRDAADRYVAMYFAAMTPPLDGDQELGHPSYPFMFGMGLAAYGDFRRHRPDEDWLDPKAATLYDWLGRFRWDRGSWYRNGYGFPDRGTVDCGFSEDNLNMGRGLMALYDITGRDDVLADAIGLAGYYLTPVEVGTYDGIWSEEHGTWLVGPVGVGSFEHFDDQEAFDIGWGFTSTGVIEFLTRLRPHVTDSAMTADIDRTCRRSLQWQLVDCQFEDGACGLAGRDDRWLGMTAGAVLSYLRLQDAGIVDPSADSDLFDRAVRARNFLLANVNDETIAAGGYLPETGGSEPRPPENLAWMLSWVVQALVRAEELGPS